MLSKSATMLLGLINQRPLNPYEIIKQLQIINVHRWYNIANSTVYATLKVLEKKEYIYGSVEKDGNMPDKTIYSLTDKGKQEFVATLQQSILSFDYDTNIFSIAAFFIDALDDPQSLLSQRLKILNSYLEGIEQQITVIKDDIPSIAKANIERTKYIVEAEIAGTESLIHAISHMSIAANRNNWYNRINIDTEKTGF